MTDRDDLGDLNEGFKSKLILLKKKTKDGSSSTSHHRRLFEETDEKIVSTENLQKFDLTSTLSSSKETSHTLEVEDDSNNSNSSNTQCEDEVALSKNRENPEKVELSLKKTAHIGNKSKYSVHWSCNICENECLPVTLESRCMCGHRLKVHHSGNERMNCNETRCKCQGFFYVVAEGAWVLRCRCKHKHIEHDCSNSLHPCQKCTTCRVFDSPWICNCGHSWGNHQQSISSIDSHTKEADISTQASRKIHSIRQDGL